MLYRYGINKIIAFCAVCALVPIAQLQAAEDPVSLGEDRLNTADAGDLENLTKEQKRALRKAERKLKRQAEKQAKKDAKKAARIKARQERKAAEAAAAAEDSAAVLRTPLPLALAPLNEPVEEPAAVITGGDCLADIETLSPIVVNGFGFNPTNTRNQASSITSANVANLERKFEMAKSGVREKRGAPAVTEKTVFFTQTNQLVAIDRESACRYWTLTVTGVIRSSSILLVDNLPGQDPVLYVGDYNGIVYAVDAKTGTLLWQQFAGISGDAKSESNHFITGGMQYYGGQLFVPVSSKEVIANLFFIFEPCCKTHGLLVSFDAVTGEKQWTFHTTEEATIAADTYRVGPNGAPVWSTPAIDPARNAIYIGTGESYTEPVAPYSDSIISLDMTTGLVNWSFQARNNDQWNAACDFPDERIPVSPANPGFLWNLYDRCPEPEGPDFDFGAAPILSDDGKILIAGDKGGIVYSLDPDSGALNWSRKISQGAKLGGIHWGMAIDEWTIYVAATDLEVAKASSIDDSVEDRTALVANGRPGIYALDITNGGLIWEVHPTHDYQGVATDSLYSASLSVTNDVLFAGSLDGVVKAFSTYTGAELWSMDTAIDVTDVNGVAGNGGTIDSVGVVIAEDTILINSGYDSFGGAGPYQAGPGNTLFVLELAQP
ncbi:PQQ-binding-like beta-propeller repeat protein [Oceanicoccus sagamiensis]|uniref:Pyrrolo-quinoline quinone repeat domain-containing protein n=1 Tax=Oceanicoccus sagamiensis TaxID=716816 RepID=A0A1X9ND19_9GAMM|nr:PQQ-binding-like beta-propeller repeat protein [Oceanicoccus sagamiensis]ARN75051.1 hypothetical protein BST96_13570 [Oceanicoccus sagamiensis]